MTSPRTRSLIALCAAMTGLMACSSDDTSGSTTTPAAASAQTSAVTDPSEPPVETDAPEATAAVTTAAATTTVDSATTIDDTTTDDSTTESITDLAEGVGATVDDTPLCKAFSRFITTSFFVGFSGLGAGSTNSGTERVEVVAYSSLTGDVATLRENIPAELLVGLESLLVRIDAAPAALAAGGFDAATIATIASAWNTVLDAVAAGQSLDDIPDATETLDQAKLDAAEVAFEVAVGTFADYESAVDENEDLDEQGNAWLTENCPILASSLDD